MDGVRIHKVAIFLRVRVCARASFLIGADEGERKRGKCVFFNKYVFLFFEDVDTVCACRLCNMLFYILRVQVLTPKSDFRLLLHITAFPQDTFSMTLDKRTHFTHGRTKKKRKVRVWVKFLRDGNGDPSPTLPFILAFVGAPSSSSSLFFYRSQDGS